MIHLLIAILMGLACPSNNNPSQGNQGGYSTYDTGGENGQIPPPPPPPKFEDD